MTCIPPGSATIMGRPDWNKVPCHVTKAKVVGLRAQWLLAGVAVDVGGWVRVEGRGGGYESRRRHFDFEVVVLRRVMVLKALIYIAKNDETSTNLPSVLDARLFYRRICRGPTYVLLNTTGTMDQDKYA